MELDFSDEKLTIACERASKRVTTYITEEIPPYLREHYGTLIEHELAWRMALESRRLEPTGDLELLFQSSCFMKDSETLNHYIVACTKLLWVHLERLCLAVLREFISVLNEEIDFPYKITPGEDFLLDTDQRRHRSPTQQDELHSANPSPLSGFPKSALAVKQVLTQQSFRLFSFLLPSLLSGRLSLPGAVIGSFMSGTSAAVSTASASATTAACLTGAVQGALAAPLGGLALLAGAIATRALVSVDYAQYTGAFTRVLGIGGDDNPSSATPSGGDAENGEGDKRNAWTRDALQRRALEALLETVANPVVLMNLRESIARLIREEVNAHDLSLVNVDLENSALCSSQRFFSLSTTFDRWRVLSVELDAETLATSEIGYCVCLYEGYERKVVSRRFSAFRNLYLTLCNQYPQKLLLLSLFPPRTVFKCTEIGFLRNRCVSLLAWLKICESDDELYQAPCMCEFLQLSGCNEYLHVEEEDDWLLLEANAEATPGNY